MWQCSKCGESGENSFEVCWNCGTSEDGVEDPTFRKVDDAEAEAIQLPPASVPRAALPADAIQTAEFVPRLPPELKSGCPYCGGVDLVGNVKLGLTGQVGGVGVRYRTPLGFVVSAGAEALRAELCKTCGSVTRLYVAAPERGWVTD
jgi:hypothetical protein